MGLLSWLKEQWNEDEIGPVLVASPTTSARRTSESARTSDLVDFGSTDFGSPLTERIQINLQDEITRLERPDDRAYGALLLRALKNDGVEPPAMPDDVLRIQRLLANPDCEVLQLARAITRDPSIAGRFVGIANSPLYARGDRVRSVDEAVVRIGMRQTSMIVMAIVAKTKLFHAPGHEAEAKRMHRHALAAAVGAQIVGRKARVLETHAFMGGLLHDIGRLWMLHMAGELARSTRGHKTVSPETLDALSDQFHAFFSGLTAESWEFEDQLVSALIYHHAPVSPALGATAAIIPVDALRLTYVIAAGDLLGRAFLTPDDPPPDELEPLRDMLEIDDLPADLVRDGYAAFVDFEQQVG